MKKQLGPSDAIFPVPAALIVSGAKEKANIITLAWVGIASSTPPTIGISIRKSRHTLELIRSSREFTVNIPTASFYKEVDYCAEVREYWTLGNLLGFGFNAGKEIKTKLKDAIVISVLLE